MKKPLLLLFPLVGLAQPLPPPAASQTEVDAGTIRNKYVSPLTLSGRSGGTGTNVYLAAGTNIVVTTNGALWTVNAPDMSSGTSTSKTNAVLTTISSEGSAVPYPSTITNSGIASYITGISVGVNGFNHNLPTDVILVLIGPDGTQVKLMEDCGSNALVGGPTHYANLLFTDTATAYVPAATIVSGTYLPTIRGAVATPTAPANGPYQTNLTVFRNTNPNGIWSLYTFDGVALDGGYITNWTLTLVTGTLSDYARLSSSSNIFVGSASWAGQASFADVVTPLLYVSNATPNTVAKIGADNTITNYATGEPLPPLSIGGNLTVSGELAINTIKISANHDDSTFIGRLAGASNDIPAATDGIYNTFIGSLAGWKNTSGYAQTFLGFAAGALNTTGNGNTFLGYQSGQVNTNGKFNVYIGVDAGFNAGGSDQNVVIGHHAADVYNPAAGTGNSVMIGQNSGAATTTGINNVFIGSQSAADNTNASGNVIIGNLSGQHLHATGISGNTLIGSEVSQANGDGSLNTMVGYRSGFNNTSGYANTYIGNLAGFANASGLFNTFCGFSAGTSATGGENTFYGARSGLNHTTGVSSTGIGAYSLYTHSGTGVNTAVGHSAGYSLGVNGDGGVFLGYQAGRFETGNNKLYIDNVNRLTESAGRTNALIYGVFGSDATDQTLNINASVKVGGGTSSTPSAKLEVVGTALIRTNIAQFDVTITDFVIGTRYTNTTRRSFVAASFQLAAAVAGTAAVTMNVEQSGVTNKLTVSAGPLASLTTIEPLALPVGPGAFYYFSDTTSGAGATATIVTGTSSLTAW